MLDKLILSKLRIIEESLVQFFASAKYHFPADMWDKQSLFSIYLPNWMYIESGNLN